MRFEMELIDCNSIFENSEFKVFSNVIKAKGSVKAINVKGLADITQGELKKLEEGAKSLGAKGLAFLKAENNELKSPILKFLSNDEKESLKSKLNIENGDIVFFAASEWEKACAILGRVRLDSAELLKSRGLLKFEKDDFKFLWVIEFPLMTLEEENGRYVSSHHPFTAPVEEDIDLLKSNPKEVRGQHYDLVLNGVELGGGSIRIHKPELQQLIFEKVLQIEPSIIEDRFGYMLNAFQYGAPPHGGIAFGVDRMVCLLSGKKSIRDVIAFQKIKTDRNDDPKSRNSIKQTVRGFKYINN